MNASILLIDQDTLFHSNLVHRLKTEKFRVIVVDRTADTIKAIKRKKIDVLLIDLAELKQLGIKILTLVKKYRPQIEVILINRSDQIHLSIEGMKLGAFDDFILPFDMHMLLTRIQEAVEKKRKTPVKKKSIQQKMDEIMVAISFAEVGETETARSFLDNSERKHQK